MESVVLVMVEFLKAELLPRGELAQENAQKIYM